MSYGSNVAAEYPASYGQSTFPNANPNPRTTFENPYQSDARYSQQTTAYPRPAYPQNSSTTNARRPVPPYQPGGAVLEMPEYDQSFTAASHAAPPMNGSMNRPPIGQQSYHPPPNVTDNHSQPTRALPQTRTQLPKEVPRRTLKGELNEEVASNQSVSDEGWLNDTKKKSTGNERTTKPAWPPQADPRTAASQDKSSRSSKPLGTRSKPIANSMRRDKAYEMQHDSHFDAARDNDASPTYDSHRSTSLQQPASTRTQASTHSSRKFYIMGRLLSCIFRLRSTKSDRFSQTP